jgi:hypothetical protein
VRICVSRGYKVEALLRPQKHSERGETMEIWIEGVQIKIPKGSKLKSITISEPDGKEAKRKALDLVDKLFQPLLREGKQQCD